MPPLDALYEDCLLRFTPKNVFNGSSDFTQISII